MSNLKHQQQKQVTELYRNIALSGKLYSDLSDEENAAKIYQISQSFGYDLEDLVSEANMGLGCGNPLENANVKPGEVVVDLGCGKGLDTFKAARQVGPSGRAIGVDRLPEMVERARAIAAKRQLTQTDFHVGEIDDLPLEDGMADCVISNCVINLVPDKTAAYREIYRVLKPGGRVSISDIVQYQPLPADLQADPRLYAT